MLSFFIICCSIQGFASAMGAGLSFDEYCQSDARVRSAVLTDSLYFPIGTKWTYLRRERDWTGSTYETITFEVVDTTTYQGRLASKVEGPRGNVIYFSQMGQEVSIYRRSVDEWFVLWDFAATTSYETMYQQVAGTRTVDVTIDTITTLWTGDELGWRSVQEVSIPILHDAPGIDTFEIKQLSILEGVGFLSVTFADSPFGWGPDIFAGVNPPDWVQLRCFESAGVTINLTAGESPCDTSYFDNEHEWQFDQLESRRVWYVLQDEAGSDRLLTRSYGLSRDSFLIDGNYYQQILRSDVEDQEPEKPTDAYLRQEGSALYRYDNGIEQLVYDYNHRPADRFSIVSPGSEVEELVCIGVDTVSLDRFRTDHRQLHYAAVIDGEIVDDTCMTVLSGVGTLEGIEFGSPLICNADAQLTCMFRNGSLRYHYEQFANEDLCWMIRTSTSEVDLARADLVIYPNPASDELTITAKQLMDRVAIYTIDGSVMYKSTDLSEAHHRIDVGGLIPGMYVMSVTDALGKVAVQKFVKL